MNWSSPLSPLQYCQWFTKCRLIVQLTSDWRYFNFRTAKWQAKWTTNRWMPVERRRRAELDGRNRPLQLVPRKGRSLFFQIVIYRFFVCSAWLSIFESSVFLELLGFSLQPVQSTATLAHHNHMFVCDYLQKYLYSQPCVVAICYTTLEWYSPL